ncbi:MAG TPA: hypothetical protein VFX92_09620 [Candidatus Krumholzibacteria bacterium]|nr:hypothetical protein [Candidatus Krumholzibacteria bacterium]
MTRHLHIACAILLALCAACGDDPVDPPVAPGTRPPVWSELTGFPPAVTLYGLWVPQPDYVIGVGPGGIILRWNGLEWSPVGNQIAYDLHAITGATGGEIIAVGDHGTIERFDGARFVPTASSTVEDLRGLWSPGGNDFYIVGAAGTIIRGDGVSWAVQPTPVRGALFAVWGSSADDVFAVGVGGTILHFDGTAWTTMPGGTTAFLAGVHGTGPDDVYVAGERGTILHYDGSAWTSMATGVTDVLQGVCATGEPAAVGSNGTILHLVNGNWLPVSSPTDEWLYGIGHAANTSWAVGARALLVNNGAGWRTEARGAVPRLTGVTGPPASPLRVVGELGYIARHHDGGWRSESAGSARPFAAAWCDDNGDVFAVGRSQIVRNDGVGWLLEYDGIVELNDIGGGPSGVYSVGANAMILRRDAQGWTGVRPTTPVIESLHAYASLAANEAYIVGDDGRMLSFNGSAWVVVDAKTTRDLFDVIAEVPGTRYRAIATGEYGVLLGLLPGANRTWETIMSPTTSTLNALASGPGGHLYALGQFGTVLSFDGVAWTTLPQPTRKPLRAAWSDGASLYAVGGEASSGVVLLRYGAP